MADRAVKQHKARQQFLDTFRRKSVTLDELVREKLEAGQFPLTKTGWIKIVAMLVSVTGLVLFFAQSWKTCSPPDWYFIVFPTCVGINVLTEFLFYMIFSCGLTVKYPGKWVSADIICNMIGSLVGIIGSVAVVTQSTECTENVQMHKIPAPLGIAGGGLSVIGCGAIFLLYRYVEEEEEAEVPQTPLERNIDLRKSMHA